jgi:hypothetical protein
MGANEKYKDRIRPVGKETENALTSSKKWEDRLAPQGIIKI